VRSINDIQIAIHPFEGQFSARWIEYCKQHGIHYKIVNCFDPDILNHLSSVDGLMWHWPHYVPKYVLTARDLTHVFELMGLKVFPNTKTCWHFDDKIGQKYLLEAVGAPIVPTHVFFEPQYALEWIRHASFPKVFKLSKGSKSDNVELIHTATEANKIVKQAFSKGFNPVQEVTDYFQEAGKSARNAIRNRRVIEVVKRMPKALMMKYKKKLLMGREIGYVYFQDFLPGNTFDTRVTVIGNRAFAFTRDIRKNDFRASGSGLIVYDRNRIDIRCITIAFDVARKVGAQSIAFDFIKDLAGDPWITEISYGYQAKAVYDCAGHWDSDLTWHEVHMWPQDAIIIDFLDDLLKITD
jgi:glutathione synthase/RimK-type ligase-like ATP-grasp enzyme